MCVCIKNLDEINRVSGQRRILLFIQHSFRSINLSKLFYCRCHKTLTTLSFCQGDHLSPNCFLLVLRVLQIQISLTIDFYKLFKFFLEYFEVILKTIISNEQFKTHMFEICVLLSFIVMFNVFQRLTSNLVQNGHNFDMYGISNVPTMLIANVVH